MKKKNHCSLRWTSYQKKACTHERCNELFRTCNKIARWMFWIHYMIFAANADPKSTVISKVNNNTRSIQIDPRVDLCINELSRVSLLSSWLRIPLLWTIYIQRVAWRIGALVVLLRSRCSKGPRFRRSCSGIAWGSITHWWSGRPLGRMISAGLGWERNSYQI